MSGERSILVGFTKDALHKTGGKARGGTVTVDVELSDRNGKGVELSVCGSVWNKYGTDIDAGGQCLDSLASYIHTFAPGWNAERLARVVAVWERWHLNGMRAGCVHQREWDTRGEVEIISLTWGPTFHKERTKAEQGTLTLPEYDAYRLTTARVYALTIGMGTPKHPAIWGAEGEQLIASGHVKVEKTERKGRGWVYPSEHPEGMLTKACDVCGHRYGSAWLYEPLPAEVLAEVATW